MSRFLIAWLGLSLIVAVPPARAETAVRFTSDWVFDGTTAYILRAVEQGYFKANGLAVTVDRGFGAGDTIVKVASGAYQIGIGDSTALIEYDALHPDQKLIGIMVVHDKSAFSVISLADKGINNFGDLAGRKIGALTGETMTRLFPTVAGLSGFDASKVMLMNVNGQIRDTLLRTGEVDAVIGFFPTTLLNLEANGIPAEKAHVLKYSDHGLDLYGSAIITSADYAAKNPAIVASFLAALAHGLTDTIQDPASAIPAVKARNGLIDDGVELRRLQMVLRDLIVTPYVRANGFGAIDEARLAKQIDFVAEALDLPQKPPAAAIFTASFLPPVAARQVP